MENITIKQNNIINFIKKFNNQQGMSPTIQEIAKEFNIKSSTAFAHIRSLQEKGFLKRSSKARSIHITNNEIDKPSHVSFALNIPLLGKINAGCPVDTEENLERIVQFDSQLFPFSNKKNDLFCLQINGDSMCEAGVFDGDYIIVKKQLNIKEGNMVVALINNNETTIKYYYRQGSKIKLKPANYQYPIQIYDAKQIKLQGIVIGLQRQL